VCATPGIRTGPVPAALEGCGAALHHHRSTAGGVFGVMLQWSHLRRLYHKVAGITQLTAARTLPVIDTIAPSAQFVFVRDKAIDTSAAGLAMAPPHPALRRTHVTSLHNSR
jgi:hypothetical protein